MGYPSGIDLCSGTFDGDTLSQSYTDCDITFDTPYSLVSGTEYAIVIKALEASAYNEGAATPYSATVKYAGGYALQSTDGGDTWSEKTTDIWFKTYEGETVKDETGDFSSYSNGYLFYVTTFGAQTFIASSSYDISKVTLKLKRSSFSILPGTITISIQIVIGAAPSKPTTPTPSDDEVAVDFTGLTLSWVNGGGATSYDVYVGNNVTQTLVSEGQAGTSYTTTMEELRTVVGTSLNEKIYWRVDAVNDEGTTTGDTWNFDPRPGAVTVPTPENEGTGLTLDDYNGSWEAAANTTSYDVYFGTLSGFLTYVGNTSDLEFNLTGNTNLQYGRFYYWKVVAVNDFGYTDSGEFTFSTIYIHPPSPTLWDGTKWYRALTPTGIDGDEGVDWEAASHPNVAATKNRVVAFAKNACYYEA